jgi:hypoxanthine phosphoribosyltransferase
MTLKNRAMSEKFNCEIVRLDTVYRLAMGLSDEILRAGFRPDVVIAVARGGCVPARLVCDFLNLHALTSIQVQHYGKGARKKASAEVAYPLHTSIRGKKALLVDDINDTGESLEAALQHIRSKEPTDIKTAVLLQKKNTKQAADFVAEYIKEWRWIIYQWAVVEDVGTFLQDIQPDSIKSALEELARNYDLKLSITELRDVLRYSDAQLMG